MAASVPGIYLTILVGLALVARRPPAYPVLDIAKFFGVPNRIRWIDALHGWWCPHPSARGAALMVHGYAMNRSEFVPEAAVLYGEGFSILLKRPVPTAKVKAAPAVSVGSNGST